MTTIIDLYRMLCGSLILLIVGLHLTYTGHPSGPYVTIAAFASLGVLGAVHIER